MGWRFSAQILVTAVFFKLILSRPSFVTAMNQPTNQPTNTTKQSPVLPKREPTTKTQLKHIPAS
jgi:hypothetical protein